MKFRKKPVEIEAIQFTRDNVDEIVDFTQGKAHYFIIEKHPGGKCTCCIDTLEGTMGANEFDYIIKGVEGEFYACKPDIFEKTYITGTMGEVSDGYHTFDELYHHRMVLFAVICNTYSRKAWKSWKHHDGTMYDDYFIVGIETDEGQYSYHYHKDNWEYFDVPCVMNAPEWDGHKPSDIERLLTLL